MAASTGTGILRRPPLISTAGTSTPSTSGTSTPGTGSFWTDTIGTSAVEAILDGDPVPLPGTPWPVRPAAGPAGRPAVEIYAAGSMLDVTVAPPGASCLPAPGSRCGSPAARRAPAASRPRSA
jgi:hypothetical protein